VLAFWRYEETTTMGAITQGEMASPPAMGTAAPTVVPSFATPPESPTVHVTAGAWRPPSHPTATPNAPKPNATTQNPPHSDPPRDRLR
jgi:hypothetical protein